MGGAKIRILILPGSAQIFLFRHSGAGRNPVFAIPHQIPAFAGMTIMSKKCDLQERGHFPFAGFFFSAADLISFSEALTRLLMISDAALFDLPSVSEIWRAQPTAFS